MCQNKTLIVLFLATLYGLVLKSYYIGRDFWHDEAFQVLFSQQSVTTILSSNDVHPPLFTLITKGMVWFTTNPFFLRLTIIIMSLMVAYAFFDLIKYLFNEQVGMYAYIFLSLSPTFALYSTEFRSYMFVMLLTIFQIKHFNKMLKAKYYNNNALFYILLSTAMVYSHYMAGLVIFTQLIYLFIIKKFWKHSFEYIMIGVYSIPLFIYVWNTLPKIQSFWFKDIGIKSLMSAFFFIFAQPEPASYHVITVVLFLIVILGMILYARHLNIYHIQLINYIWIPILTMWIISQVWPFFHHRYFMFGGIMLFALAGWVMYHAQKKYNNFVSVTFLFVFLAVLIIPIQSSAPLWESSRLIQQDYPVVHTSQFSQSSMKIYLPDHQHMLMTNFTKAERFSAGGIVIMDSEIIHEFPEKPYYFVSDITIGGGEYIFRKEGLNVKVFE